MKQDGSGGSPATDGIEHEDDAPDEHESWLREACGSPPATQPVALPAPGQVVGDKYRVEELLGRGGMGAVFRATHVVSGKPVALKWMLRGGNDERALQRFTREARAAARISHPNVVDVYDIHQDGATSYLVMELLRGESLRALLARGPLPAGRAVSLLLPAMNGVAAAHREGVIHRDLKPDNVFLCRGSDGEEREGKVLDFGISAITAPDHETTTLTRDGAVLGTPVYMSPEQLQNAKDVDARTDVYSLGVILYEALSGRLPFSGDSYSALVLAIGTQSPRPLSELRPDIPAPLARVVMKALAKDRAERFPSVEALMAALRPFDDAAADGVGAPAKVPLFDDAPEPRLPRTRLPAMLAGGALLVVTAALWWLGAGSAPPTDRGTAPNTTSGALGPPRAAPSAAPVPKPTPPPPPAPFRTRIVSTPEGAEVVVARAVVGVTPYLLTLPADTTELVVTLRLADHAELQRVVSRRDGAEVALTLTPLPQRATAEPEPAPKPASSRPRRNAPALAPR